MFVKHQPQPTKLPSFNELLTSIPLPNDFFSTSPKSTAATPVASRSTSSSSFVSSPQSYTPYQPQPVHFIPLQYPQQGYVTYSSASVAGVSPKTMLDIPTPPPSTDSLKGRYSPESPTSPKRNAKRKHVCKICSRSFTTSGHLARHNRIHTGERKHVCPWPTCEARFARQDNCMQHYKTHTNGKNKRSKLNFKNASI